MKLNSKEEFDNSINLTRKAFMIAGFEIGEKKYYLIKYLYYFNLVWIYTDVFAEIFWLAEGISMGKSLDELSLVVPCMTICILSTMKVFPFILNKNTFQEALQNLRRIHLDDEESENIEIERKIVLESQKILKVITTFVFISALVVIVMFSVAALLLMGYEYYQSGDVKLILPFLTKYFFDPYANTAIWSIIYVHQCWSTVAVAMSLFSADCLFYIFCTYLWMHFRILRHRFQSVVTHSPEKTRENMMKCVKRHQQLIELVDLVELLYSKSNLLNVTSSCIMLCLCGFNIMVVKETETMLTFGPFLLMSLTQVFYLCFFGDLLMASSIEISKAVYGCRWYKAQPAIRKYVLIIMICSQKPCKVTAANFTDINLTAFTVILSRSYSFFALLKTMYD